METNPHVNKTPDPDRREATVPLDQNSAGQPAKAPYRKPQLKRLGRVHCVVGGDPSC